MGLIGISYSLQYLPIPPLLSVTPKTSLRPVKNMMRCKAFQFQVLFEILKGVWTKSYEITSNERGKNLRSKT